MDRSASRPEPGGAGGPAGGPRRSQSLANTLRKQAGLAPEAIGLVQEALHAGAPTGPICRGLIKALPVRLVAPAPIERAISSAGGLRWRRAGRVA